VYRQPHFRALDCALRAFPIIIFSLYGYSRLSLISYGLSIIASYIVACLGLFLISLLILVACCSHLGLIYVIRVYDANSI
jgi:hypothetical protein